MTDAWWVYMLECGDGSLYTGITNDLRRRLEAHADGSGSKYTRTRMPVRLVYRERCADRSRAQRREAQVKQLSREAKLDLIGRAAGRRKTRRGP